MLMKQILNGVHSDAIKLVIFHPLSRKCTVKVINTRIKFKTFSLRKQTTHAPVCVETVIKHQKNFGP